MLSFFLWFVLYGNFLIAGMVYRHLYKSRKLVGYHLGMNIAMTPSGVVSLVTGLILIQQFPAHYATVTIITTTVGIVIGVIFGAMVDYQTLLMGFSGGIMSGIMAPMIGDMSGNSLYLIVYAELLLIVSFVMLYYSIRS